MGNGGGDLVLRAFLAWALVSGVLPWSEDARAEGPATSSPTFWVDAHSSTWLIRGHNLFDLEASVRVKLASAGLTVVRHKTDPHEFLLKADYRETKGQQFSFDVYGTDIACTIRVARQGAQDTQEPALTLTIQASSGYPPTGVAPYLDALHRFETNPYFFLLGDLVKGEIASGLDRTASLVEGLKRLATVREPKGEGRSEFSSHTMLSSELLYTAAVTHNTIQELGRLKDSRAVPVLTELLRHDDRRIRLASVTALGAIASPEARPALERTVRDEKDPQIRQTAASVLAALPAFSGGP